MLGACRAGGIAARVCLLTAGPSGTLRDRKRLYVHFFYLALRCEFSCNPPTRVGGVAMAVGAWRIRWRAISQTMDNSRTQPVGNGEECPIRERSRRSVISFIDLPPPSRSSTLFFESSTPPCGLLTVSSLSARHVSPDVFLTLFLFVPAYILL